MASRGSPQRQCLRSRSLSQRQCLRSRSLSQRHCLRSRSLSQRHCLRSRSLSQRQKSLSEAEASLKGGLRGTSTRERMDATHKHAQARASRLDASASAVGPRVMASEVIRGHQRSSAHRCGASCGALCGTYVSFTPLWPEGHRSARVVTSAHELLEGEAYLWGRGAPW
jgi:hypothetical protein